MAAEVVGTAFVVLRAITTRIASDIKDGIDKGAEDADTDAAGEKLGQRMSKSIGDGIARSKALDEGLGDAAQRVGAEAGEQMSEAVGKGIADSDALGDGITEAAERARPDIDRSGSQSGDIMANALRRAARAQLAADGPADWIDFEDNNGSSKVSGSFSRMWRSIRGTLTGEGEDGGKRFSDAFTKGFTDKNPLSKILGAIKFPPMVMLGLLAVPAIGGALKLVGNYAMGLVSQIGYLATAAAGLGAAFAGLLAGVAIGFVPLAFAFSAPSDALDALMAKTMTFADAWREVGLATQKDLLPALGRSLDMFLVFIPAFKSYGEVMGGIIGSTAEMSAAILTSTESQGYLNQILFGSVGIWDQLRTAVINVVGTILPFLASAQPIAVRLATSIANVATKMNEVVNSGAQDGSLTTTLTLWYDRAELVVGALADILVAIWNTFKIGADVAQPFFDTFDGFAQRFRDFTESAKGKAELTQMFENAMPVVKEVNGLIGDIIKMIFEPIKSGDNAGIIGFLQTLRNDLLPALGDLGKQLSSTTGPALQNFFTSLVELFTTLAESGAMGSFINTLTAALQAFAAVLDMPIIGDIIPPLLLMLGTFKALNLLTFGKFATVLSGLVSGLAALTGLTPAIAAIGSAIGVALGGGGFAALGTAIGAAVVPFLTFIAVAAAIVGAIFAIYYAFTNWDKVKEWIASAWNAITDFVTNLPERLAGAATALWSWIQDAVPAAFSAIGGFFESVGGWLIGMHQKIAGWLGGAAQALGGFILEAVPWLAKNLPKFLITIYKFLYVTLPSKIIGWLANAAEALWSWIVDAAPQIAKFLSNMIVTVGSFLLQLPGRILSFLAGAAAALFQWVSDAIPGLVTALGYFTGFVVGFLISLPGKIWGFLSTAATALFQWIVDALPGVINALGQFTGFVLGFIISLPGRLIGMLAPAANAIISWIIDSVPGLIDNLAKFLGFVVGWLVALPGKMNSLLVNAINAIVNWIIDSVPGLLRNLASFLGNIASFLLSLPGKIVSFLVEAVPALLGWVADAARQVPGKLLEFASAIYNWVSGFVRDLPGKFAGAVTAMLRVGRDIIEGVWQGIQNAKQWLMDRISGFAGGLVDGFMSGLGIKSPSRVMASMVGVPIAQGLALGMEQGMNRFVEPAANGIVKSLTESFGSIPLNLVPDTGAFNLSSANTLNGVGATVNAGSQQISLQVMIGDRDITDIVDVQIGAASTAYSNAIYSRGVTQ